MTNHTWPAESKTSGLELERTNAVSLLPVETAASDGIASPTDEGPDGPWFSLDEGQKRAGTWNGVWPLGYRRALGVVFLSALLAMSMVLGILAPGPAIEPLFHLPAASSVTRHRVSRTPPATLGSGRKAGVTATPAPDAAFAIATLGVHCFFDSCVGVLPVAPGQRIYSTRKGITCTTTGSVAVVGHSERVVYCRVEQPNVFDYSFDGAQFDCVGSWLGCHNVMIVDTTNGR
jgi:hypothetical protein